MRIKQKFNDWYTKPRFFDGFTNWILTNPKALSILMIMGHIVALILFLTLFIFAIIYWGVVAKIFLGLGFVLTLWNLIKYVRFKRKTGSIFDNIGVFDLLFDRK